MNKKQILAKVRALLSNNPMLSLRSYSNKNDEPAFSIFGFEVFNTAQLPQDAKELLLSIKSIGKNASYAYDQSKGEGSIYVGPVTSKEASDDDILNVL